MTKKNFPLKNKGAGGYEEFSGKGIVKGKGRTRKTVPSPYEKKHKKKNLANIDNDFLIERRNSASAE